MGKSESGSKGYDYDPEEELLIAKAAILNERKPSVVHIVQFNLSKSRAKILAIPREHKHLSGKNILFLPSINN